MIAKDLESKCDLHRLMSILLEYTYFFGIASHGLVNTSHLSTRLLECMFFN